MANTLGKFNLGSYYNVTVGSPLDVRTLVTTVDDLTAPDSWNEKTHPAYKGMLVVVEETGEVFVLKSDHTGVHNFDNWKKIGADEVISISQIVGPEVSGIPGNTDAYQIILNDGSVFDYNIYNGLDGKNGIDGSNGIDGKDGTDGKDGVTPKIKIEEGFWWVSYDNEQTWSKLGESSTSSNVSANTVLTETYQVKGGPLSSLLNNAGIYEIEAGNLHELLKSLFCKEDWPTNLKWTKGTFTKGSIGSISISASSPVEIGSNIKFTVTQGSAENYNKTSSSVTGFINGYSTSNNGTKENSASKVEKDWTITKGDSNYTLIINNGTPLTGSSVRNGTYETIAQLGSNICSASSEGYVTYTATIQEIPVLYAVSSLGNTSDDYKTEKVSGDTVTVTSGGTTTNSKTVTGVYPVYYNLNSTSLLDSASNKKIQTSATFEFSEIESEEATGKIFIFEYPAHKTISSFMKKNLPEKYNYYTNISGNSLLDAASTNAGKLSTSITITVPAESAEINKKHFVLEFTNQSSISKIEKYNPNTKDWSILNVNVYKITNGINKNGHTYNRFETIGGFVGESKYRFTFNTSSSYTSDTTYIISDPFNKEINGTTYEYRRLTTDGNAGIVSRKITLNSTLDS